VLGICYGAQLMAHLLGGKVGPAPGGEYGRTKLVVKNSEPLFTGTPTAQDVWMSHGDQVVELPSGFEVSASTEHCRLAAFQKEPLFFAVQFHPEVAHTQFGNALLKNFVFGVAKAEVNWNITDYVSEAIRRLGKLWEKTAWYLARSVACGLRCCGSAHHRHWAAVDYSASTLILGCSVLKMKHTLEI